MFILVYRKGALYDPQKEPRIEKCYTALNERAGGLDFHAGLLWEQEGYKYDVFTKGRDIMTGGTASYFELGGKALGIVPEGLQGRQNLVDWHDVSDYYDKRDKEALIEDGLRQLYTTDEDETAFKVLRGAFILVGALADLVVSTEIDSRIP